MRDPTSKLKWRMIRGDTWHPRLASICAHECTRPPCSPTQMLCRLVCASLQGRVSLSSLCLYSAGDWTHACWTSALHLSYSLRTNRHLHVLSLQKHVLLSYFNIHRRWGCTGGWWRWLVLKTWICTQTSLAVPLPRSLKLEATPHSLAVWGQATSTTSTQWKFA